MVILRSARAAHTGPVGALRISDARALADAGLCGGTCRRRLDLGALTGTVRDFPPGRLQGAEAPPEIV